MADYNSDRTGSNIDFTLDKVDALDAKVQPTATGVDVTGTITADGLTVDGDSNLGSTTKGVQFTTLGTGSYKMVGGNSAVSSASFTIDAKAIDAAVLHLATDGVNHLSIAQNGDVSFYEDTGTTAKMVWSSSTESLGIGVTDPVYPLEVQGGAGIELYNNTGGGGVLNFRPSLNDINKYNMSISSYDHSGGGVGPADGLSINGFDGVSIATGSSTARQERMRIDSAGNVGIGTDSPSAPLTVTGNTVIGSASNTSRGGGFTRSLFKMGANQTYVDIQAEDSTKSAGLLFSDGASGAYGALMYDHPSDSMLAVTNNTERARIDSSGNLLVGKTAFLNAGQGVIIGGHSSNPVGMRWTRSSGTGTESALLFFDNSGNAIGSISTITTATSYNTSSDERLKENIQDTTHSVDIDDIQVREFDWKVDGSHQRYGFIAQELETVYPEAVHSPEDADEMKSVDYSKLVPLLVKEIQILKTRIEILESK